MSCLGQRQFLVVVQVRRSSPVEVAVLGVHRFAGEFVFFLAWDAEGLGVDKVRPRLTRAGRLN